MHAGVPVGPTAQTSPGQHGTARKQGADGLAWQFWLVRSKLLLAVVLGPTVVFVRIYAIVGAGVAGVTLGL